MGGKSHAKLSGGLAETLGRVAQVLELHAGRGVVIGGIAVIARGVPRVTRDIDVVFAGAEVSATTVMAQFEQSGIHPRIADAVGFAAESQVLLMRDDATGVEVDVSFAWLGFELEAIAAAGHETIAGVTVPTARAEDLVIFKAIAWRPQDQQDVERLLALHDGIDLTRVRRHVDELSAALELDRRSELDELIARVRGPGV